MLLGWLVWSASCQKAEKRIVWLAPKADSPPNIVLLKPLASLNHGSVGFDVVWIEKPLSQVGPIKIEAPMGRRCVRSTPKKYLVEIFAYIYDGVGDFC